MSKTPSAKTVAKQSAKMTTAAMVSTTICKPRPRLVLKHMASLPSAEATTDENPPPANSNPSKDPDPPLPVSVQETSAPLQSVRQTASQAPALPLATSTSGSTQAPDPVPTEAATSTIQSVQLPDPAPAKDSEDSNIAKKLVVALAEIDRLKKLEAVAKNQEVPEIKRLEGKIMDLQKAMGLENQRALYIACCISATVRDVMELAGVPVDQVWRKQEPLVLAKIVSLAKSRNPQLGHYELGWATLEIIRTNTKNKRNYNKKIGHVISKSAEESADDDGMQDGVDIEFSDSGDEGGTSSAGKRKLVVQHGIGKKAGKKVRK